MNKEIKDKWVAALRSGEYKQGTNFLRTAGDSFCCLGVLCEIMKPGTAVQDTEESIYKYDGEGGLIPEKFAHESGLTGTQAALLMSMNDSGDSFPYIAGFIERNL